MPNVWKANEWDEAKKVCPRRKPVKSPHRAFTQSVPYRAFAHTHTHTSGLQVLDERLWWYSVRWYSPQSVAGRDQK